MNTASPDRHARPIDETVVEIRGVEYESDQLRKLKDAAKADNTRRTYAGAWKRFETWLGNRQPTDALLAEYIAELHQGGKSPATLSQAVAAVRFHDKAVAAEHTALALAGARRDGRTRGRGQMKGITWKQVEKMCAACEAENTLAGVRDSALLRVMSDCLLRVSEVAAIAIDDLKLDDNALVIPASKTDPEGEGATLYLGDDTVEAIRAYLAKAKPPDDMPWHRFPLFQPVNRGDRLPYWHTDQISPDAVRKIIKRRAKAARVRGAISGHSLRIGSAVSLAQAGATVVDLQTTGRWKDPSMPAHYAAAQLAKRNAIARFKYDL